MVEDPVPCVAEDPVEDDSEMVESVFVESVAV